ncbi:MAG: TorF family putative porin [Proteobacteria bacterium]|nr:TorF family putative porin [Pseudomonadota bacterium]
MKFLKCLTLVILSFGIATSAYAEQLISEDAIPGEFSASVLLTNDYVFRGISQTGNNAAIQGSLDYEYDFGPAAVHAGIWASNVKFTDATIEIDYTVGVGGSIDDFSWDVSAIYYTYPGAESSLNYDFFEIAPSVGYDFGFLSASAGVNYSPDYFGDSGDALYSHAGVEVPLGPYFTLGGNIGYQSIDNNANFGTDDYLDWGVAVSTELAGFTLSIGYNDTDLDKNQCDSACGNFVASVSRSF